MSRKKDRETAFKLIFDYCLTRERDEYFISELKVEEPGLDFRYIEEIYSGVIEKFEELLKDIEAVAKGFSIDRIFKVDLAIILLALYEIKFVKGMSPSVAINEAINIAKVYSTEKSGNYINGILSNFVKK